MRRLKCEKETIILTNEDDGFYDVYTFNQSLQKRLRAFAEKYPDDCWLKGSSEDGSETYIIKKGRLQSVCLYRSYRPAARQAAAARWISPHCCSGRKIDLPKYDTGLQGHRIPVNSAVVPCSRYSQGSAGKYITRRLPFCGSRRIHFSRLL